MFGIFFWCLIVFIALCLVDFIVKKIFLLKYAKGKRILPYLPLIGSAFLLMEGGFNVNRSVMIWLEKLKEPTTYLWFFNRPYYITMDPDEVKILLNHPQCLSKGYAYKFISMAIKDSLLCSEVNRWRKHRKVFNKCFGQRRLEEIIPTISTVFNQHINLIQQERVVKNLVEKNGRIFLTSFLEGICDFHFETTTIDLTKFYAFDIYEAIKVISASIMKRIVNPWLFPDFIYYNTKSGRRARVLSTYLEDSTISLLDEKRQEAKDTPEFTEKDSFLTTLLKNFTDIEDMVAEMKLFGGAASETSGTSLAAILNILGMYPEIQNKVYQEVTEVLGLDREVSSKHLLDLKYTEMVIQETMRIFAPVPLIVRKATADIQLGNSVVPNNTDVIIPFMAMHRSPLYWNKPLEFIPERFTPKEIENRHPYVYIPFSAGPRNCIGAKYAMMSLKTALAKIVVNFEVRSYKKNLDELEYEGLILLNMPGDMSCEFIPRY